MTVIEVLGRVNEQGQLEFEQPAHLPPGDDKVVRDDLDTIFSELAKQLPTSDMAATPRNRQDSGAVWTHLTYAAIFWLNWPSPQSYSCED